MESGYTFSLIDDEEKTLNGYERNCLFWNRGNREFVDIGHLAAVDLIEDGRGVGISDFDRDGDLDIVVQNWLRDSQLLVNQGRGSQDDAHWLQLHLRGTRGNRNAIGAKIRLVHGDRVQTREITHGSGYMSTQSLTAHFGLGADTHAERIEITWPGGARSVLVDVEADRRLEVIEGSELTASVR